tara:strand:- start:870 stop:1514 length:645 start_codon:yes stop_codon:yes gene_type:complete
MEIIWLGHSCFRLRSQETVVITDPFPDSIGMALENRSAHIVTISNNNVNHSYTDDVSGNPKMFSAPGEYEYSGVSVKGAMTPLDELAKREERNIAFTITLDGINICHLGKLTTPLTTAIVDELGPIDVLLVPVGGHGLIELNGIQQIMQDFDPKIVIPMQYKTQGLQIDLDTVDAFLTMQSSSELQPQPRISVTPSNLPPSLNISLLSPQSKPS